MGARRQARLRSGGGATGASSGRNSVSSTPSALSATVVTSAGSDNNRAVTLGLTCIGLVVAVLQGVIHEDQVSPTVSITEPKSSVRLLPESAVYMFLIRYYEAFIAKNPAPTRAINIRGPFPPPDPFGTASGSSGSFSSA